MTAAERETHRKLMLLRHTQGSGNVSKSCRFFGISRKTFAQGSR